MDEILMRHPELGAERTFPASAVPFHVTSGWVPVDEEKAASPEPPPVGMSAEEAMALGKSTKGTKGTTKDEDASTGTKE